jgi:hypothetical protein
MIAGSNIQLRAYVSEGHTDETHCYWVPEVKRIDSRHAGGSPQPGRSLKREARGTERQTTVLARDRLRPQRGNAVATSAGPWISRLSAFSAGSHGGSAMMSHLAIRPS